MTTLNRALTFILWSLFLGIPSAIAEDTPPKPQDSSQDSISQSLPSLIQGWSISGLAGLNLCLPSGSARCDSTYPGVNFGLSTEYKWRYFGISGDLDWGSLSPTGQGSDDLTHRFGHLGLGLRGYLPLSDDKSYYLGINLGMGEVTILDADSDSSVTWKTLWSDLRLDLGALWRHKDHFTLESALSLLIHLGGERCDLFRGAGPCRAVSELPDIERSSSRVLMLRFGIRWMP